MVKMSELIDKPELRSYLWITHIKNTGHIAYGDDGEMQCNTCHLDFKRYDVAYLMSRSVIDIMRVV
jgi:hypothetical protein